MVIKIYRCGWHYHFHWKASLHVSSSFLFFLQNEHGNVAKKKSSLHDILCCNSNCFLVQIKIGKGDLVLSKGEDKVVNNALCKRQTLKGLCPTLPVVKTVLGDHFQICLCFFCSHFWWRRLEEFCAGTAPFQRGQCNLCSVRTALLLSQMVWVWYYHTQCFR